VTARRAALVVALLLLAYVAFSVVWMLTEPLRVVPPTPTRTPKPTYTPAAIREALLIATPTPTPSPTVAPPATPTATGEPTIVPIATPTPRQHVVQAGDTLLGIAQQYGVDYRALLAANDIKDPDILYVGQVLTVPASVPTPASGTRTHIVRAGETLLGIAVQYGVVYKELLEANAIVNPDRIYVGQVLTIPASAPVSTPPAVHMHIVQAGETLLGIAARYGVAYETLLRINAVADPDRIYVGQVLIIPEE